MLNGGRQRAFGWSPILVVVLVCSLQAQRSTSVTMSRSEILPTAFGEAVDRDVIAVRAATESFKVLDNAVAAGYEGQVSQCVENPTHGGMGFHHKNSSLRDARLEIDKPEILLYARMPHGQYTLTGVEYIVPISAWSRSEPPTIMGQPLRRADTLGVWYLHVWIWEFNPSGLFADWNPRVTCPQSVAIDFS